MRLSTHFSPTAVLLLGGIGGLVGPDVDGRLVGRCVVALVVGGAVGGTVGLVLQVLQEWGQSFFTWSDEHCPVHANIMQSIFVSMQLSEEQRLQVFLQW